ncbi:hypothetical protein ECTPHS_13647 [Ectothiorhodospira sp. PHS-1]|nr:hypothetical protein ECTPHS_13647 [Ectothiorhodospira sp. PHS-1]
MPGELLPGLYDIAGVVTIDSSAAQNLNFLYGIPAAYVYPMFEVEGLYLPSFKHEVLIQSSSDLKYFARDCLSVVPPGDHVAPADSSGTCKGWLRDIGLA